MKHTKKNESGYLRVIDAAANRACEALRVIEDFVRFLRDDPFLVEKLKTLRHRLMQNVLKFPMSARLVYRETLADVGTKICTDTEFRRSSLSAVLDANFSRLQESLRSLEEFSKLTEPAVAHEFEQIRYFSYTLQRAIFFTFLAETPTHTALREMEEWMLTPNGPNVWRVGELRIISVDEEADFDKIPPTDGNFSGILLTVGNSATVKETRNRFGLETLIGCRVETEAEAEKALLEGIDFLAITEMEMVNALRKKTVLPVLWISDLES